jgi:hypothetical protein
MRIALATVIFVFVLVGGCTRVDNAVDCYVVCDDYEDCFDSDYDRSACYERCRAQSTLDDNHAQRVDACRACIHDRSCREQTFSCAQSCSGVVP